MYPLALAVTHAAALTDFAAMLERIVEGGIEAGGATRDQVSGEVTGAYLRGGFPDQELWRRVEGGRLATPERLVEHLLGRGAVRDGEG